MTEEVTKPLLMLSIEKPLPSKSSQSFSRIVKRYFKYYFRLKALINSLLNFKYYFKFSCSFQKFIDFRINGRIMLCKRVLVINIKDTILILAVFYVSLTSFLLLELCLFKGTFKFVLLARYQANMSLSKSSEEVFKANTFAVDWP